MTVEVRDTSTLLHAISHHAKALEPLVGALSFGILTELVPRGWSLRQSKVGPQSFCLYRDGREYHFRASRDRKGIVVKDAWTHGKVVTTLTTRVDVLRFIRACVRESGRGA